MALVGCGDDYLTEAVKLEGKKKGATNEWGGKEARRKEWRRDQEAGRATPTSLQILQVYTRAMIRNCRILVHYDETKNLPQARFLRSTNQSSAATEGADNKRNEHGKWSQIRLRPPET